MHSMLLINGPNLNLLGTREPGIYGTATLPQIVGDLQQYAEQRGARLAHLQSNAEHEIIDAIQAAHASGVSFIVINAGAFTHTSIAIRDALAGVAIPFIEVHISNVYAREGFRHHSYLADIAQGVIAGLGVAGYRYALDAAINKI